MALFRRNFKKIKGAAHKDDDIDGTCKRAFTIKYNCFCLKRSIKRSVEIRTMVRY